MGGVSGAAAGGASGEVRGGVGDGAASAAPQVEQKAPVASVEQLGQAAMRLQSLQVCQG